MNKSSFFSLSELKQPVNQWICLAFIGVLVFWIVLYYFTQKAEIAAESYTAVIVYNSNEEIRSAHSRSR